jgi:predicted phage terminase large subunit-like protein
MRKNLEHRWENSDFLQTYLPREGVRFTDVRYQFTNLDGHKFVVRGYGAKTGVRGAKEMGQRPTLAVMDDLVSDEDARSATVIASIEDTVHKAVNYALHSTRSKKIWSGTPFNARDPLYKVVESGAWHVNVYPVCEKFPCSREEFKGSWEDRFSYDYVKDQYDTALALGQIDSFNQELMLRIMSDEDRLIRDEDIGWYSVDNLLKARSNFNFYITTDFATNEATASDYSVVSVWALNNNGDWFLVDAVVKRQLMDKNIDDLFRMVSRYKPMEVGIEVSGQQRGFLTWIKKEMLTRNIFFNLTKTGSKEGVQPTTDKMTRFNVVVPWFKAGKMYFPEEAKDTQPMRECMEELGLATVKGFKSKHDDFIDCISMLALLNSWKPSYSSPFIGSTTNSNDPSAPEPWGMYGSHDEDFMGDSFDESPMSSYVR